MKYLTVILESGKVFKLQVIVIAAAVIVYYAKVEKKGGIGKRSFKKAYAGTKER